MRLNNPVALWRVLCGVLVLVTVVGLSACGSKEKKAGQALVRVNGQEITVLQINDELKRARVKADQQEAATKQLLETLIDRQLFVEEAMRNKIDRTPGVIQAIERAKMQIIAQAYLESIVTKIAKPSKAEIDEYFQKHPEYFTQRKQFDLQQLVIATKDLTNELKLAIDTAKTLDEVAAWMDGHNVRYARGQLSRSSTDLPELMVAKLNEMKKGQLFIVNEGENSMLNFINNVKDSPVTAKDAAPQIEQYLINKKSKEAADAEIKNLRSSAKIEYLNAQTSSAH
jgi:EpsD family peptidyl-prolyl cis-trans isomerase